MQTSIQRLAILRFFLPSLLLFFGCVHSSDALPQVAGTATAQTKEFDTAIQKYLELRKKAVSGVKPLGKEVTDPALIMEHEKNVANAIRALRPNARQGELFTPVVRGMIVATIKQKTDGKDGAIAKSTILGEGNPKSPESATPITLAVNAPYPATAPLSTIPPSVLLALPTLPKELEFRFVGRNLILRDTQANMIVDILPDVL